MKKVFAVCLAAGLMLSMVACGPSAEEQAKKEQEVRDELKNMFEKAENEMKSGDSTNTGANSTDSTHAGHSH